MSVSVQLAAILFQSTALAAETAVHLPLYGRLTCAFLLAFALIQQPLDCLSEERSSRGSR